MGKIIFQYPEGATPLELEEIDSLIPENVNIQSELNEWYINDRFSEKIT